MVLVVVGLTAPVEQLRAFQLGPLDRAHGRTALGHRLKKRSSGFFAYIDRPSTSRHRSPAQPDHGPETRTTPESSDYPNSATSVQRSCRARAYRRRDAGGCLPVNQHPHAPGTRFIGICEPRVVPSRS